MQNDPGALPASPRPRVGVLLVNLGTPDAPQAAEVRRYLRQFLLDPRVIDIPWLWRVLLVQLLIVPWRAPKSAAAYRKVWTEAGSPLLVHGRALQRGVAARMHAHHGDATVVALAMRYGNPSIASALDELRRAACDRLVVFPLYPQYAASATGSTLEEVYRLVSVAWNTPFVQVVPPFFDDAGFIAAFADVGRPVLDTLAPDHVLFSFHGLPERHVKKSDESGSHCLQHANCCARIESANRNCYRAQCFATARLIAHALALPDDTWTIAFQSRLGRTPWIRPYSDVVVPELAAKGVRKLAVFCPAFVADCLETEEEVRLRLAATFQAAGGERLELVPSLNATPRWIDAVTALIEAAMPELRTGVSAPSTTLAEPGARP